MQPDRQRLYLLYHEIRSIESAYSYVTSADMFGRHLDLYAGLRQAGTGYLPELTFDDGHISNVEIAAAMLADRGMTALFFITVGWTGKRPGYMGWPQLRRLQAAGQNIGAHGWSHTLLTHCNDHQLRVELNDSRKALEDNLGSSITTMSLPGGRANNRVLAACEAAGYTHVFTSVPKTEAMPLGKTVGRFNIQGNMQPEWIAKVLEPDSGVLSSLQRQHRIKQTLKSLLGDKLYARLWALRNRQEPDNDNHWEPAE
jgi:peptidoglycan/xylan/chitin deacetylase (PgdA/CDA1 family)